uniref:Uncharacterized protein n=1 Tax=Rhizophora mucronata TaxID=61149 RepID=A0A2P2QAP1_RHIMU
MLHIHNFICISYDIKITCHMSRIWFSNSVFLKGSRSVTPFLQINLNIRPQSSRQTPLLIVNICSRSTCIS